MRFSILTYLVFVLITAVEGGIGVKLYEFQVGSTTLYHNTCGNSESDGWKVSKNSCNFYTATTEFYASNENPEKLVFFETTLQNSGNLEPRDFAWIFYYLNNRVVKSITIRGDVVNGSVTIADTLFANDGDKIRMRISFVCDGSDEFWLLPDRGISIYSPSSTINNTTLTVNSKPDHAIVARINDNNINVTWSTEIINSDVYYLVERSTDGKKYNFAGYVKSGIIENEKISFSYTDNFKKSMAWYKVTSLNSNGKKLSALGVVGIQED